MLVIVLSPLIVILAKIEKDYKTSIFFSKKKKKKKELSIFNKIELNIYNKV